MIAKQQAKREQSHLVYLHTVEKYKKVSINTQNDHETSEKWTDKKKTNLFCVFCKIFNSQESKIRSFKRISMK